MKVNKLPQYETVLFCEIYDDVNKFIDDYNEIGLGGFKAGSNDTIKKLFYLLYGKYGNNPIANYDINQFKFKLFGIVNMYGPAWEKRLEIQTMLRDTPIDELQKGSKAIYNHAFNPSTDPSTGSLDELNFINEQNTTSYKSSKIDTMTRVWDLLNTDVTNAFLNKFIVCFKKFVAPLYENIYVTEDDDDEE